MEGRTLRCVWAALCLVGRRLFSASPAGRTRSLSRSLRTALPAALLLSAFAAVATTYVYDSNGRLVVATNDAGESARYVYDAMGNLKRVDRLLATDLAVFGFSPGRGAAGQPVRIQGRGFDATPAQNAVAFNGTSASVIAASATELTALVPVGATTGPITVTVGGRSADSVGDFVVDPSAQAPVIDSFSPAVGKIGDAVAVVGRRLQPVAGQTTLRLNGRPVAAQTVTDTAVSFVIPSGAGSGKIELGTPYGVARSGQSLLVLPAGIAAASVVDSKDAVVDGAGVNYSIATAGEQTAALIRGERGDYLSAQFSNLASLRIQYWLYGVDNAVLGNGTVSPETPTYHLPKLPAAGTYLLIMRAQSAPASWTLAIEKAKPLAIDGVASAIDTATAGQQKRLTFEPAAGVPLGLGLADRAVPTNWGNASVYVYDANSAQVGHQYCEQAKSGCALNLSGLGAGTHTLVVIPASSGTRMLGFDASLSTDQVHALGRDTAITLAIARRGQNARLSFAGAAGEVLALQVAGQVTVPASRNVYFRVTGPDGTTVASSGAIAGATLNLSLPAAGNYQVLVDPEFGETAQARIMLATGTVAGLQIDGNSTTHATTLPGEGVYLSFDAGAGQHLGLGISDLTVSSGAYVDVTAYKPDGSVLALGNCHADNNGCDLNLPNLTAGRYAIAITPSDAGQTMQFQATLSSDASVALPRNAATAMALPRRGQNGRMGFSGVLGEIIAVQVASQSTTPLDRSVYYRIYKPDGSVLASMGVLSGKTINLELPATGNYQLYVDPEYGATSSAQVTLTTGVLGEMELDAGTGRYETTQAGTSVTLTINASAGQNLGLGLSDLVLNTGSYVDVYVYKPGGDWLTDINCEVAQGGCGINLVNTLAGTYTVSVRPSSSGQTMKFKATLSSDAVMTFSRNTPLTFALERRGQNARLSFAGTAGEVLGMLVAGQSTFPEGKQVRYTVYKPDGYELTNGIAITGVTFNLRLPVNGTYRVFVDPEYGAMPTARLTLSTGTTSGMELDGASANQQTSLPGQGIYLTADASNSGLGLGISDLAVSSGNGVKIYVNKPDGSWHADFTCEVSAGGCAVNLPKFAGRYGIAISPIGAQQTMSLRTTLSSDKRETLSRDSVMPLTIGRRGQNARLSFTGAAGEILGLAVAGQATFPDAREVRYAIIKPDGYELESGIAVTGVTYSMRLPSDGTYEVFVDPSGGATATSQVTLSTGTTNGLATDGGSVQYETILPGQGLFFAADATNASLGFGISDLVVSSGSGVKVYAYKPDNSWHADFFCEVETQGCSLNLPKATGRYAIYVVPTGLDQAMSFKATLSSDQLQTLTRDTPLALNVTRRGQNARLSFTGSAGETIGLQVAGQSTFPAGKEVAYAIIKPDGYELERGTAITGVTYTKRLPSNGSYYVFVDPQHAATVASQVTLSTGTASGLVVGGPSILSETSLPGQGVYFTADASASALGLGISELAVSSGAGVKLYVEKPDGSWHTDFTCEVATDGCNVNLPKAAGRYGIAISPVGAQQTMSFKATLSADVAATLTRDSAYTLSLTRRGQNGRLSFTGSAGETIGLMVAGQSTLPADREVAYVIIKPDGYELERGNAITGITYGKRLPSNGTYQVFVDPQYGATASSQVTLSTGTATGLSIDGASVLNQTTLPGQGVFFTADATAAALGFGISELALSSGNGVKVYASKPDGSWHGDFTCEVSAGGCGLNLPKFSGRYGIAISPIGAQQTMSFKATLSTDQTGTLTRDSAHALSIARRGQNGRLSFAGTANEHLALLVADQGTAPSGRNVTYSVIRPNGTELDSGIAATGVFVDLALNATGTYQVFVDGENAAAVSSQVILSSGAGLSNNGGDVSFQTTLPGQRVHLVADASATALSFVLSDLQPSVGSSVKIYAYKPDGSWHADFTCNAPAGCSLALPQRSGRYSVYVSPASNTQTMTFKAKLTSGP
jgi:YD repeat-containing protein